MKTKLTKENFIKYLTTNDIKFKEYNSLTILLYNGLVEICFFNNYGLVEICFFNNYEFVFNKDYSVEQVINFVDIYYNCWNEK